MNKILVALDGSPHSVRTLEKAAQQAHDNASELVILYACTKSPPSELQLQFAEQKAGKAFRRKVSGQELPEFAVEDSDGISAIADYVEATETLCQLYGEDVLERAKTEAMLAGVDKVSLILEKGDAANVIVQTAEKEAVDLLVIGHHGVSKIKEFFLGSIAKDVLKRAPCAALVVE